MTETRVLPLDGTEGTVYCEIHGDSQHSLWPVWSRHGRLECCTRSYFRLRNLVAVRGDPQGYMIGPCDYYGNLENPHLYWYTIRLDPDRPRWQCHPHPPLLSSTYTRTQPPVATLVSDYRWRSHYQSGFDVSASLFPNIGQLQVPTKSLRFVPFDARTVDLSEYRVRLVPNHVPFRLTDECLPERDEYRLVSYDYGGRYATQHPENNFLEQHPFAQTMTPLEDTCGGFVVVGKFARRGLCLVAVRIPLGYTLIVDPFAVHGDSTLQGKYMMAMTSQHTTMEKADTVLLRTADQRPVIMTLGKTQTGSGRSRWRRWQTPRGKSVIFQPIRASFWNL